MSSNESSFFKRRLRRLRDLPARLIGRTPWLRRWYSKRILHTIDKFQKKHRPLPENLQRLERQLRRVPQPKRQGAVEEMMELGTKQDLSANRALRRASGRQDRQKGSRGGGLRPGMPPTQPRPRSR
ncbi:MAG: hypothetical protein ACRDL8_05030 [Solirubrobacteraceae bacterium]